jgi:NADH:ubiquinone oxidoreductase subunit 4 (subunit M)
MGKVSPEWAKLPRLSRREIATLLPLVGLIILLGVLPGPLVSIINAALHSSNPLGILLRGW